MGSEMCIRDRFEMLCHKLNGLENSIAEMRRELELSRHPPERSVRTASDASAGATQIAYNGVPTSHSHTDVHGIHTKNDAVRCGRIIVFVIHTER